ncbi:gamma-glutamyltransferase [Saccharophagus degradans]|uniref:Glutathione hydrolase proenzyme n=1 Tax=Saccharophagus degradans TaxID=86304 RepID=A0AAW7X3E2_9GAMM|nr:gamma-glutamyltransferase [Saccharophagus degradans]MDO6422020.1 gamma-glutamyltransferase [Saccharophagus degradans]MDO6606287.1 gamma-glutamyltransferase [Saccharophagus degradans]WGO97241.1 gamma-glutamyltransferase [Saccharophagus degradans]
MFQVTNKKSITILALLLFLCAACQPQGDVSGAKAPGASSSKVVELTHSSYNPSYASVSANGYGAIASVNPLATQAGLLAYEQGGNAIDAAIATALTLGVVDSHNSGIGGGCFVLIRWADGSVSAIDGREMAPAKAHPQLFIRDGKAQPQLSKVGALASGIPGSLKAYEALVARGGKLTLADALQAGIRHADQGFPVDRVFASRLKVTAEKLQKFPASAGIFLKPGGAPYQEGELLVQKDLANTYRKIAAEGSAYFYGGDFAKAVESWMADNGGIISAEDFANYRLTERQPVKSEYRGYTVYGFPPPSSGGAHVAQILNILAHFDLAAVPEAERYHLLAEAMKLAFADRAYWLGDPDYTKVPKGLVSAEYAADLAATISNQHATTVAGHGTPPLSDSDFFEQLNKHTTHIAAADKDGNWVAITTTLNTSFGSKVVAPGTGVLLNNQMDDFSIKAGEPNAFNLIGAEANKVEAGKRPLSSMSPTLVLKGDVPVLTLGAAGGPTIINQVVQALVNNLDMGMPLDQAVAAPRVHHQWMPNRLTVEGSLSESTQQALQEMGHEVKVWGNFGATQAIGLDSGDFKAVAEPRVQ